MDILSTLENDIKKAGGTIFNDLKDVGYFFLSGFTNPTETVSWTVSSLGGKNIKQTSEQNLANYAAYQGQRNIQAGKQFAQQEEQTYQKAKSEVGTAVKAELPLLESETPLKYIPFSSQIISSIPTGYAIAQSVNEAQNQLQKSVSNFSFGKFLATVLGLSIGTPLIVHALTPTTSQQSSSSSNIGSFLTSFLPLMVIMMVFMFIFSMFRGGMF